MADLALTTTIYSTRDGQVSWCGVSIGDEDTFKSFLSSEVASRLHDEEGVAEFEAHLRGLATTGFAHANLDEILAAEIPEERDWAVGEAMAEAYLSREHGITWPWNMERDKRNPNASLPGADLVGFQVTEDETRLVLGEVKTSTDQRVPPGVMSGRSGMAHQIDNLAGDLSLIYQLLKWLLPRCKGTEYEASFNKAVALYIDSGNKAAALFGILVRDTEPNEIDLRSRGEALAGTLQNPTTCALIALYIPCDIAELPNLIGEESA